MHKRWSELISKMDALGMPISELSQIFHLIWRFNDQLGEEVHKLNPQTVNELFYEAQRIKSGKRKDPTQLPGTRGLGKRRNSGVHVSKSHPQRKFRRTNRQRYAGNSGKSERKMTTKVLDADEKQRCLNEGRCFKCKEKGHRSRNCPDKSNDKPSSKSYSSSSTSPRRVIMAGLKRTDPNHELGLLEIDLFVNGKRARTLIDGGSEINAISKAFVDEHQLPTLNLSSDQLIEVIGATPGSDGDLSREKCQSLRIRGPGDAVFSEDNLYITRLNYDMILGKPWLNTYNPMIDWQSNVLTFQIDNRDYQWTAASSKSLMPGLKSAKQINNLLKKTQNRQRSFVLMVRADKHVRKSPNDWLDYNVSK